MRRALAGALLVYLIPWLLPWLLPWPLPGAAARGDGDEEMGRRLQEALRRRGGSVHRCYAAALDRDRLAQGEILLQVELGEGGKVRRAEVLKDQSSAAGLGACLVAAISGWSLPELRAAPGDRVVFPLAFRPDMAPPPPIVIGRGTSKSAAGPPLAYVSEASHPGTQATLQLVTARPGPAPPRAAAADTALFVLSGRGKLLGAAGPGTDLGAGDGVLVPPGARFALSGALRYVEFAAVADGPRGAALGSPSGASPLIVRGASLPGLRILGGRGQVKILVDQAAAAGLGRAEAPPGVSLEELSCEAGVEIPVHVHEASDELLYIVSGRGVMSAGEERDLPVGPGDAVRVPRGVPHGLLVRERLVAVQSYAPAGPEQRFRAPTPASASPGAPAGGDRRGGPKDVLERRQ